MARPVFAALLGSLAFVAVMPPAAAIVIDDFSAGGITISGPAMQDQADLDPAHVIGGARRIQLGQYGHGSHLEVVDDRFKFNSAGWGYVTLTYGATESLGSIDLTQNGHDRFRIKFGKVTTNYTPMGLYVNLDPGSSSNGVGWAATKEWDGGVIEVPFANFRTSLTSVQKIVFDAFRNQAGTEFEVESISTAGPHVGGDFNRDGVVDADDLKIWEEQLGMSTRNGSILALFATADGNLDGRVDGADFLVWQRSLGGQTTPAAAVPEPVSLFTTVTAALWSAMVLRTARRHR